MAADGATTSTITVTLKDAQGNPVSGKTVTLAQTSWFRFTDDYHRFRHSRLRFVGRGDFHGQILHGDASGTPATFTATDTTDKIPKSCRRRR